MCVDVVCWRSSCQARRSDAASTQEEKKTETTAQADELISIRQLRGRRAATAVEVELDDEADITKGACQPPCHCSPLCLALSRLVAAPSGP